MTPDAQPPRRAKQAHYLISFCLKAVRRVEAGGIQPVLAAELGVARITLIEWLRRHWTAAYAQLKRKIFAPAQKHAVARELRRPAERRRGPAQVWHRRHLALVCPRQPASSAGYAGPQRAAPTRQLRFSHAEPSPRARRAAGAALEKLLSASRCSRAHVSARLSDENRRATCHNAPVKCNPDYHLFS